MDKNGDEVNKQTKISSDLSFQLFFFFTAWVRLAFRLDNENYGFVLDYRYYFLLYFVSFLFTILLFFQY